MTSRIASILAITCAVAVGGLLANVTGARTDSTPRGDATARAGAGDAGAAAAPPAASSPRAPRRARPLAPPLLPRDPPVTDEAIEAALAEEDARLAVELEREPPDANWAATATERVTGALRGFGSEAPLRMASLECRSSMCRARIEWTDASEDPMAWAGRLVGANYGLGCSTRIRFDPERGPHEMPAATLFLFGCPRAHAAR